MSGPNCVINEGDVTDIAVYEATPYRQDDAGYAGADLVDLPADRDVEFTSVEGLSDTEELEKLIDQLSAQGGGKILIKSGQYAFRDVLLKSNVHITIESNTTIELENKTLGKNGKNGYRHFFSLSSDVVGEPLENVKIVGLGTPATRPQMIVEKFYESWGNTMNRAFGVGYVKNALIENFTIVDDYTLGAAIALNPVDVNEDGETAQIPENVTIANVALTGGSIGYGLVQTNVGRNILLKNLSCEGGMTCRIEAHNGRKYDLGVYNIVVKNVASINGKAAVLLQPHSVLNGRILVDGAKAEGSTWVLFLKEGFVGKDSKRREKGLFDASSEFSNISMVSTDNTATLSFKNFSFVPTALQSLYNAPNYTMNTEDSNYSLSDDGTPGRETAIEGPSVGAVYIDATYPLGLPSEDDIVIDGMVDDRVLILRR